MDLRRMFLKIGIMLLILFFPMNVYASVSLEDHGNFFSEREKNTLENTLRNTEFHYYIKTLQSLDGENIETVSQRIFDEVRPDGYDAVILLSMEEGEKLSSALLDWLPDF
ncbi:putative membrane protein YgcG [Evansella vedderi]|uniref:Membrane protein YgcG n=1 Tax=Evansella vedderi TaxID=38282 RepID=A0ABT9ZQZ9_9BACI|nr:hypothetical protein [Evansella vedderi]MDQ0252878.1 putative membrane protein YgcG [Evansella vedderi]